MSTVPMPIIAPPARARSPAALNCHAPGMVRISRYERILRASHSARTCPSSRSPLRRIGRPSRETHRTRTLHVESPTTLVRRSTFLRQRGPMTEVRTLDHVVIRFAGDSGDGMQLTGDRFTAETATFGNDIATLPNFPAEIRAPAGTLPGVSSFQLHFANSDIATPGDHPEVLVAMNPASLKVNLPDVRLGGMVIVDTADFTERNLARIGYATNPLTDGTLDAYQLVALDLTGLAVAAVKDFGLGRKDAARTKNMFALGLLTWLYGRPVEGTEQFLGRRFAAKPDIRDSNIAAFRAGHAYGAVSYTHLTLPTK